MKPIHWATVAISFITIIVFYAAAPLVSSKGKIAAEEELETDQSVAFDWDGYKQLQNSVLKDEFKARHQELLKILNESPENEKARWMDSMAVFWFPISIPMAASYLEEKASIYPSVQHWLLAGDTYSAGLSMSSVSGSLDRFVRSKAMEAYGNAHQLQPNDLDTKVKYAASVIDYGQEVMNGVQMLLSIVAEDSLHIQANLILGRYGLVSGQFDKAIKRLETVVGVNPQNAEALFYLAEAYNGIGRKEDAIRTFEECKKWVDNPDFQREINDYIQTIRKNI